MKVRMKLKIQGTRNGVSWPDPGEVVDLPQNEAVKLCDAGYAVPVKEDKVEKAVAPQPESRGGKVSCPEDGCDYEGSKRGLKIHAGQVHG